MSTPSTSSSDYQLVLEFTVEPFVPASPGPHVIAAQDAAQAVVDAGGTIDIGPFGTTATGPASDVLAAVSAAVAEAFGNGADRVSLQLSRRS